MTTLVLDVNETLSDLTPLGEVVERYGLPAELTRTWFASVLRDGFALSVHRQAPGFLALGEQVLGRLLTGRPLEVEPAEVVAEVLDAFRRLEVHPDVPDGLRSLAADGHRLVTFTNGGAAGAEALLERAGVRDVIDRFLSVEGLPVWKPHPDSYAHAVRALEADPADLVLVAVHPWDLDGASRAGWRTAYVDRTGAPWPAAFTPPDVVVGSVTGLADALRAASR